MLLRREGWPVNKKWVRRLYRLEGLQVRLRGRRRKHMALHRAYWRGVQLDFIRPGKPVENAHLGSFNGRLRYECLNSTGPTAPSGT